MGAQNSKSYTLTFLGLDATNSLQVLNITKLRHGHADKILPRIANIVNEVGKNQIALLERHDPSEQVPSVHLINECGDEEISKVLQPLFYRFFKNSDGVVYIITGINDKMLEEELKRFDKYILRDDATRNMLVMILANEQQSRDGALTCEEIVDKVKETLSEYDPMLGGRTLFVRGCNSQTKVGLEEAFSHFAHIIQLRRGGEVTPGFHNFNEDELFALGQKTSFSQFHSRKKKFNM